MGLWEDTIDYGYILGCNILNRGGVGGAWGGVGGGSFFRGSLFIHR